VAASGVSGGRSSANDQQWLARFIRSSIGLVLIFSGVIFWQQL
jgi:hypothetical protein